MSDGYGISNNAGPGSSAEPSMEEVLASIRRILSEEEAAAQAPPAGDDVILLTPDMLAAQAIAPAPHEVLNQPLSMLEASFEPPPAPALSGAVTLDATPLMKEEPMDEQQVQPPAGLVGEQAATEITNTLGSLVRSLSSERGATVSRAGVTIEDLVREEIKPVLKSWLDTYLPTLVERVVRAEIARVMDRTQP